MLILILVIAAVVPLVVVAWTPLLGGTASRRDASGRSPALASTVLALLAVSGALVAGSVTALGQGTNQQSDNGASSGVVVQASAAKVSGRVTDGSGNGIRDVVLTPSDLRSLWSPIGGELLGHDRRQRNVHI